MLLGRYLPLVPDLLYEGLMGYSLWDLGGWTRW